MIYCAHDGCDGKTTVVETRGSIRRRRCLACSQTFLTEEIEYKIPKNQKSPFTLKAMDYEARREKLSGNPIQTGVNSPKTSPENH